MNDNTSDLKALKKELHSKRMRKGYMWALFCAIGWALWYIAGTLLWSVDPFYGMYFDIAGINGDTIALILTAVMISALTAITAIVALLIWNRALDNHREIGRSMKEFHPCSKWFFLASIFGGPIAIVGSFIAMGIIGPGFTAVAGLTYPIFGALLAWKWYGEKISKRAALGIMIIIVGGITIFGGAAFGELAKAEGIPWLGIIGGLMGAIGFGTEGAIVGKGIDVTKPEIGLTIRYFFESGFWFVLVIPLLAIVGYPIFTYAFQIFDTLTIIILAITGFVAVANYASLYKSYPLVGVAKGQGIANLYGLLAVIFSFMFFGDVPEWTIVIGAILCIGGSYIMFSESHDGEESLRGV
ncbi:DMT family transporter [Methanolobus sp. ZRKC2]|uniref:EamA family transporter n=1 Tax=Methanolobus sp. ZRKC2 TaxID=3125783 RepID=UPI0032439668